MHELLKVMFDLLRDDAWRAISAIAALIVALITCISYFL